MSALGAILFLIVEGDWYYSKDIKELIKTYSSTADNTGCGCY